MSFSKVAYSGSMFLFLRCNCDPLSALLIYLILLGLLWLILPPQKMQWKKERHWVNVPRPQPSKRAMISGMGIRSPHGWRCAVKTKSLKKKTSSWIVGNLCAVSKKLYHLIAIVSLMHAYKFWCHFLMFVWSLHRAFPRPLFNPLNQVTHQYLSHLGDAGWSVGFGKMWNIVINHDILPEYGIYGFCLFFGQLRCLPEIYQKKHQYGYPGMYIICIYLES